ncbi:MAG: serine/threonine protein kinase [Phycisphaeraceae bacterium]|nr:MAG: serine/threonine protein kinase [Phycisphaeraceae bacterium]
MARALTEFKKGDTVEGFRVLQELGRGAASIIYLVQDVSTKQVWALKHVEKLEPKDQRFLDQAEAEADVNRQLNHPKIRRIERVIKRRAGLLSGVSDLYIVMELVDGESLDQSPPRTFEQAVDALQQAASALAYMHSKGFVHADMKPNNIVMDANGQIKIIDLGQSCKIGTVKERIQGTPDYIAPEQVHCRPITPKTDIYNLGATIYYLLTRQKVPTALAGGDSLVSRLDDNFIEKPKHALELNPRIHPKLADLVMQCVEVDPEKRPESMQFVADRLSLILGILRAKSVGFNAADSRPD